MKLYKIAGYIANGGYKEKSFAYEVEETEKCFVGSGKRVDKSKLGVVSEGKVKDGFEIYLIDEEQIDTARRLVYGKCLDLAKEKYEQAKVDVEGAKAFCFPPPDLVQIKKKGE